MASSGKSQARRGAKPLYRAAKISDRQFQALLYRFVLDDTASEAARQTGISLNSVAALFNKLRAFFVDAGLFIDPEAAGLFDDNEEFELHFLEFHLKRMARKRGYQMADDGRDLHIAESLWRFNFHMMTRERPAENVHAMMLSHLLEMVRVCGPVGSKPVNRYRGLLTIYRQMDQRLSWMERNAPDFRQPEQRAELRAILNIRPARPKGNQALSRTTSP